MTTTPTREPLVFATTRYQYLQEQVCHIGGLADGLVERQEFPDGERYQRILHDVAGRAVAIIGGTISDTDTLELYDLACALVKYGAASLTLVIPYFGYSTMERAVRPGEVVVAKTRARLLSSIPAAASGNCVVLVDLHAEGITHYFEGATRAVHSYAKPIILDAVRRAAGGAEFVLASVDAGRAKWVQSLARDLKVPAAFVLKHRTGGARTEVVAVHADVAGQHVVIYDDMIRTGGSLLQAAASYHKAGAKSVAAVATHGVLPEGALARIRGSGLIRSVAITDTHPRAHELAREAGEYLHVYSVAGLLVQSLKGNPWNW